MRNSRNPELTALVAILVLTLVVFAVAAWIDAKYESETYNRLTGAHTTTWDALWVELRVQGEVSK